MVTTHRGKRGTRVRDGDCWVAREGQHERSAGSVDSTDVSGWGTEGRTKTKIVLLGGGRRP